MAKKTLAEMVAQQAELQKKIEKSLAELAMKIGYTILEEHPWIQSISEFNRLYKLRKDEFERLKKLEERQIDVKLQAEELQVEVDDFFIENPKPPQPISLQEMDIDSEFELALDTILSGIE